jgi:hypothetical protein
MRLTIKGADRGSRADVPVSLGLEVCPKGKGVKVSAFRPDGTKVCGLVRINPDGTVTRYERAGAKGASALGFRVDSAGRVEDRS